MSRAVPSSPLRPPVQARSQATYRRLLDSAEDVLTEKGFDETSVSEISARAGLTVGAFYARFAGKEALLSHLEERLVAEMESLVDSAIEPSAARSPREQLEVLVRELVAAYNRRRPSARMLVLRSHSDPALKERLQDLNRRTMGRIAAMLADRARLSHPDPEQARPFALLAMRSVLRDSILFKDTWFGSERLSENDLAREVTRMLAEYLGLEKDGGSTIPVAAARRARPADVRTIDGLMKALYDVLSGPAGDRDWNRLRSLYAHGATLLPTASPVSPRPEILDVEAYIRSRAPFFRAAPFYEVEVARETKRYGNLAQIASTYEAKNAPDGPVIFGGTNVIHLVRHGGRWMVTSIAWANVRSARKKKPTKKGSR